MAIQFLWRPVSSTVLALLIASSPFQIVVEGNGASIEWPVAASAKDNGKDKGNDRGGESNDTNGKDKSQSGGKSQKSGGANQQSKSARGVNPKTGDIIERRGRNISVRHSNGIFESIVGAVYEMRDAQGRRIIRRPATNADRARLAAMSG
ncbi:hypothetical protein QBK99_00725 [Corticibacterium sp. UT-5YL-CI-8]|nr:hypothetical protein [Tianweitania sp. UT-5YL-CI-8]